jgi:hypothetical protein
MKSPSLDNFYAIFNKHILLAQGYSEIKELSFIIKSCRLKPYNYIFSHKNRDKKLILYTNWIDEHGNSLKISKKLKIKYNDLSLDHNKIICTDLYYGLSLDKIIKISKLAFIFTAKDEDLFQDCLIVAFLGIDNYLRAYLYLYDEWQQIAPILLGIKNLKTIYKHIDAPNFIELKIKENIPFPCLSPKGWITSLPVSNEFLQILERHSYFASTIFTRNIING